MSPRTTQAATAWGGHLRWEVRQLCRLAIRLEELRRGGAGGPVILHNAIDDAVLEAFLLHARSLVEFLWLTDDSAARADRLHGTIEEGKPILRKSPRREDVLAEHYFDAPGDWHPGSITRLLAITHNKTNWGVAHCSYRRLDLDEARGWEHAQIARDLIAVLFHFTRRAVQYHLDRSDAREIEVEMNAALEALPIRPDDPLQIVGTPPAAHGVATPGLRSVYADPAQGS